MYPNRRAFLKLVGAMGAASFTETAMGAGPSTRSAGGTASAPGHGLADGAMGVLVDIPNCVGCRKCEFACQEAAGFDVPPITAYEDKSVFEAPRWPRPDCFTVVNRYPSPRDATVPVYVKVNCMHCLEPACASACLVGALHKEADGAVTYDAGKCMGCRYCMIACPFDIPKYEYDKALTPWVRKCTFCFDRTQKEGGVPACVKLCPQECLTYGRRGDLLAFAHSRIAERPADYVDHVYGESELGGTSWMFMSTVPFDTLGFADHGQVPPSHLTESIQHGVFKRFVPPLSLFGLLGMIMGLGREGPSLPDETLPTHNDANCEPRSKKAPADPADQKYAGVA